MADDLTQTGSDVAGTTDPASSSSSEDKTDYKSKYVGLNQAHSKLLEQVKAMQKQMADSSANYESQIAEMKAAQKPESQRIRELNDQLTNLQKERDQFASEATSLKTEKGTRQLIKDKFSALMDDWDDGLLRERKDFADDAAFEAYLTKVASKRTPAQPEKQEDPIPSPSGLDESNKRLLNEDAIARGLGQTPSLPTQSGRERGSARTVSEIQRELWACDTRTAEGKAKADALTKELDRAL